MRFVFFAVWLWAGSAFAGPVETLVAGELGKTPLLDDLAELSDTIGGRLTGSRALDQAIDWAVAKLEAAGVETVRTENYVAPHNWLPRVETAEIVEPRFQNQPAEHNELHVAAMPMAPSTPAAGITAGVFDAGAGDPARLVAASAQAKGKWVLVHTEQVKSMDDVVKVYFAIPAIFVAAKRAGAVGVLLMSNRPYRLRYRHITSLDSSIAPLPGVLVEREGAERIARLIASGHPVTVHATIASELRDNVTDRNVIAEIKGRDKPDEIVAIGAHLDSWDLGTGALDNGCNAATLIDIARHMMALAKQGIRPRRTLRFILYSGEELGLYGSRLDVQNHRAELDKLDAMIVLDTGTGRTTGFTAMGRADIIPGVDRALVPVTGLGPFTNTLDASFGYDNYDYLLEGVPTLVANQDTAPYFIDYHAESDTFDKVDPRELRINAAIAASLVWNLADDPKRLGARQNRLEVGALLNASGLADQMKALGLWTEFATGKRGRAR